MVLDERDAVDLYVVDLGSELDALVLLAAHYRADIGPVDADDAVLHFLSVEVTGLLAVYFSDCQDAFVLLCGQSNHRSVLAAQTVPLADEFAQQRQQPALYLACGRLLRLTPFGVCEPSLGHFVVFAAGQTLALCPTGLMQQSMQPFAAFPHQLDVCRIAQAALVAGGVAHAQVLVLQQFFPLAIQHALLPDDVERRCQPVAYRADDLAVPDGI